MLVKEYHRFVELKTVEKRSDLQRTFVSDSQSVSVKVSVIEVSQLTSFVRPIDHVAS